MNLYPQTREEAAAYRYGQWAGEPNGRAWREEQCAYEVFPVSGSWIPHQCQRRPGHGPAYLYCAQHAKKMEPTP